jgi:hypothetical protein
MPAANKRFCEMAVKVHARILVLGITVGRCPNFGWVEPPLRKAAGRCRQAAESAMGKSLRKSSNNNLVR